MTAQVELVVGERCPSCDEARSLWVKVVSELDLRLAVRCVSIEERGAGRFTALPVLLVDGRAVAVGVPSATRARELLAAALQSPGST